MKRFFTTAVPLSVLCLLLSLSAPSLAQTKAKVLTGPVEAITGKVTKISAKSLKEAYEDNATLSQVQMANYNAQNQKGVIKGSFEAMAKAPAKATYDEDLEIRGSLLQSRAWLNDDKTTTTPVYGVYSFKPAEKKVQLVNQNDALLYNGGGFLYNNWYAGVHYDLYYNTPVPYFNIYNATTWEQAVSQRISGNVATDMTYDITTNTIYGCFYNDNFTGYELASIPITEKDGTTSFNFEEKKVLTTLTAPYYAIACDYGGNLYGIDGNAKLYKIDKTTGAAKLIGNTGVTMGNYLQSATFDRRSGKLYWASVSNRSAGLYEVNTKTAEAKLVEEMPNQEEFSGIYVSSPAAYNDAPGQVTNLNYVFEDGSLNGKATFKLPAYTAAGELIGGELQWYIVDNGDTIATGKGQPEDNVSVDITAKSGENTLIVTVANLIGSSEMVIVRRWVGPDTPEKVTNFKAELGSDNVATLTWDESRTGSHGGSGYYFHASDVTYDILRMPDSVVVATGVQGDTYKDTSLSKDNPGVFNYVITPVNLVARGDTTQSNVVLVGGVNKVPYDNMTNTNKFKELTIVDGNNDGHTFGAMNGRTRASKLDFDPVETRPNGTRGAMPHSTDEYIVTPLISLESDKIYSYTLLSAGSGNVPFMYDIAYGADNNYRQYTVVATDSAKRHNIHDNYSSASRPGTNRTYTFRVPSSGAYRIAFHIYREVPEITVDNMSEMFTKYLTGSVFYFKGMSIHVVGNTSAPDSVVYISAKAAPEGGVGADITVASPISTIGGALLNDLQGIRVYREDSLVADIPATEGRTYTVTDDKVAQQLATYKAIAYSANGESPAKTTTVFVGVDEPLKVSYVKLTDAGDHMHLAWGPTKGVNGGYIDQSKVRYTIAYPWGRSYRTYKTDIQGNYYDIDSTYSGPGQKAFQFAVIPVTDQGTGRGLGATTIVGQPYTLPFKESFGHSMVDNTEVYPTASGPWWTSIWNDDPNASIQLSSNVYDYDDTFGYINLGYLTLDAHGSVNTPRINLAAAKGHHAKLTFYYRANAGLDIPLYLVVNNADQSIDTVKVIDQESQPTAPVHWQRASVDLTKYIDSKFIMIYFGTEAKAYTSNLLTLDDIEINTTGANDLAATLETPKGVVGGNDVTIGVKVTNTGLQTVPAGYKVSLYANDKLVETVTGDEALAEDSAKVFNFTYKTEKGNAEDISLRGEVSYDADDYADNNKTADFLLPVEQGQLSRVEDLKATKAATGIDLTWSEQTDVQNVTKESFEDFTPFTYWIDEKGWKSYSRDDAWYSGNSSYIFDTNDPIYANGGFGSGSFRVYYPDSLGEDDTDTTLIVRSADGHKFLICSAAADYMAGDTWLISPKLESDKRQTISFLAESPRGNSAGDEILELLYSPTDSIFCDTVPGSIYDTLAVSKFKLVDRIRVTQGWKKYFFTIPDGSKYFAIRLISPFWFVKADAFIYRSGTRDVTGYNIYRNGQKIGTVSGTTGYTDTAGKNGDRYTVTVLYGSDESIPSNEVTIQDATGISDIGTAIVSPHDIYTIDGRLVRKNATSTNGLQPGVYVKDGKKIIIRQ